MDQSIIDYLIEKKLLDPAVLEKARVESAENGSSLEEILVYHGMNAEEIAKAKGEVYSLEYVNLADVKLTSDTLRAIPQKTADAYQVIAFEKNKEQLKVGIVNPKNFKAVQAVEYLAKREQLHVDYYVVSLASFKSAQKKYQALGEEVGEVLDYAAEKYKQETEVENDLLSGDLEQVVKSAPVSKIVSTIIKYATSGGASDIHIEPFEEETRVRFRVDGILRTALALPAYIHPSIVSRIKVLSNLKLDETRIPQDGRIKMKIGKQKVDLRVSTLPLVGKEKVVMRVLDTSGVVLTLEELGYRERYVKMIEKAISKSHGKILATGPTGSGKSTTLYSLLNQLNSESSNIVTLEDPAEYFIPGINQSQVNAEVGFSFSAGLRSLLRQDPDVLMVGEIRDEETAELSVHAALTGHIVFSTLHTNNAAGALPRLIDMNVEPFLISSTLECVIAQRLVRKVCPDCKAPAEIPQDLVDEVVNTLDPLPEDQKPEMFKTKEFVFYHGTGCGKCNGSGYKGRTVIAEVIIFDTETKEFITNDFDLDKFMQFLVDKKGFSNMMQDGFLKVLEGHTTVEEVLRVIRT
jgi:type IV pilus assembly protein PilB